MRQAADQGLEAYAQAFLGAVSANPAMARVLPFVLYETLGPTLPAHLKGAAALWGLAQKTAMTYPEAVRRAGHADGNALFEAIMESRSGVTFTEHEYEDDFALIGHADHKIALEMPEMLRRYKGIARRAVGSDDSGVPGGAVGGRTPCLHRQRHLPRSELAQARCRRRPARQR